MRVLPMFLCALMLAPLAFAFPEDGTPEASEVGDPLDGKIVEFTGGEHKSRDIPLSVAYDGPAPSGRLQVEALGTGRKYPAMLHDGELHFVAAGAMPGNLYGYQFIVDEQNADAGPLVNIEKQADKDILDVFIEGEHFTSYHYSNDWKKPFLWPVNTRGGVGVTRDYPMSEEGIPKYAKDHPHHKSCYVAYGDVNGVDLWGEGDGSGFQHSDEVTWGSGDVFAWVKAKNTWQDNDHSPVITEEREYRFYLMPDRRRLIDLKVTFTADHGDVKFGDTKEGGLCSVRMRPEISYKDAIITNAHGDVGEPETWGKPSPWCDYSAETEDFGTLGLAIFDHPTNFRHPTSWHVRGYGLMGANCFGYSYFSEKDYNKDLVPENGDWNLPAGESKTWNYRIYVHTGDVEQADVADRFADYATPPALSWKK
jgi:hypothetical protein